MKKLGLLLILTAIAWSQTPYTLEYKLQPGKAYVYSVESKQKMTQEMGGQEMVSDNGANNKLSFTLQSKQANGDMVITAQFLEKRTKIKNFRMDTTLVETDQCGKRVELLVNKIGKTLKVTQLDSFPKTGMMGMMGGDAKLAFKRNFWELPEKPVAIGDVWSKTTLDTIAMGNLKIFTNSNSEFKLAGEEERLGYKCLVIQFSGPMTIEGKGNQMGVDFVMEGTGKVEGTIYYAASEGLLIQETVNADQEVTIAITGQGNMTIPQTTNVQTTMTLVP
jgi:hypothetical protein